MKKRPLRIEHALDLLPETDALLPLRRAVLIGSREAEGVTGGSWARYATLDTRAVSADLLESRIADLVQRDADRARILYSAVVEALRETERGNGFAAAAALIRAGEVEEEAGLLASAESFYRRAEALGSGLSDRREQSLALRRLGRVAKARGRLEESLKLYAGSFDISQASRDLDGAVIACQGMGNVLVEKGLWTDAEEWYRRGVELLGPAAPSRPLWQLQSNLSLVTRRGGDLVRSREWLDAAKATVEELGDSAGRVYVLVAEGLLLVASGDAPGAEIRYLEALDHATSSFESARALVNLGECLVLQKKPAEAERVFRKLELLALTEGLLASLPHAYRGLGAVARERRDPEGFLFFEQALELCRTTELPVYELALTQLEYAEFEADQKLTESAAARLSEAIGHFAALGTEPERERAEALLQSIRTMDINQESE